MQDQLGNTISISSPPQRIVSLVPSQTELLFDLGLDDQVRGVTKFCIHPKDKVRNKIIIGGTKNFRFDVIDDIKPDLIIGNKEENYQEGIEKLAEKYPVWMSDIYTLEDALVMINSLAQITRTDKKGLRLIEDIENEFNKLNKTAPKSVLYFIWNKPYMVAGNNTFISHILEKMGLTNSIDTDRYPELSPEQIKEVNPDVILLSSEPYPFKPKHFDEFKALCPNAEIRIIDGEMFSWYGSRLLKAPKYLNSLAL